MLAAPVQFYDATTPRNVPDGAFAAVYVNGAYKWSDADVKRMGRVFRVSVEASSWWADSARCIDIEKGAGTPQDAVSFVRARREYGFDDATVYVNRSNWPTVRQLIAKAGLAEPLWWVSTLDGTTDLPGAWAVQFQGGVTAPYDLSVLHGVDNLHRP